jgi:heme exporter protein CcmD
MTGFLAEGDHWEFVIGAYAATTLIMVALVWASLAQGRRAKRDLDALEGEAGPRRRRAR